MTGPDQQPESTGALDGLRVVDLTHHLGGPLATMALAQLGADVVKVEPPEGDGWRHVDDVHGESRVFHAVNRGKRGVVLDLRRPGGARGPPPPGGRRGRGRPQLRPRGRRAHRGRRRRADGPQPPARVLQPLGVRAAGAARHGRGPPVRVGPGHGERRPRDAGPRARHRACPGSWWPGILAALLERERSGRGQHVETSLLEASAALAAHRLIREGSGEPLFNRFVGRALPAVRHPRRRDLRWPATPPACTSGRCGPSGWATCSTTRVSRTPRRAPATRTSWRS